MGRFNAAFWARRLSHVPTWAIDEELQRRGERQSASLAVHLPGVTVDPLTALVHWRGDAYHMSSREMEVVYAVALAQQQGRRRVHGLKLAPLIWRGFEREDALANMRSTIGQIRRRIPGLLPIVVKGYYELALDPPAREAIA